MGPLTALALGSAAVLAYTYVGYPALMHVLARVAPAPPERVDDGFEPTVTACVPACDAGAHLAAKLESLVDQDYPAAKLDVLVYSDGSTDETLAIAAAFADRHPGRVRVIEGDTRRGKPSAINAMRPLARGEVLLMTDARQTISRNAVRSLVRRLADADVGCVSGNLVLGGSAGAGVYWRYEKWLRRNEGRFRSLLGATGALYAVRARDVPDLPVDLILDDMWVPMRLRLQGKRLTFCDEAEAYEEAFHDEREFGRKVRTLAGNVQLFRMLPGLLVPGVNPSWFETVSHKALRLACPYALGALLASTAAGCAGAAAPQGLFVAAFGAQAAFYGLALLGPRAGRLAGVARTFVVMNAAAVKGLFRALRGAQRVTW